MDKDINIGGLVLSFLFLIFLVPPIVGIIKAYGSEIGGIEGGIIEAIADIMSPEVSIILLIFGTFSLFVVKMIKSSE